VKKSEKSWLSISNISNNQSIFKTPGFLKEQPSFLIATKTTQVKPEVQALMNVASNQTFGMPTKFRV
jgi:hypothetical protein